MLEKLVSQEITNMAIKYHFIYISKKIFRQHIIDKVTSLAKIYSVIVLYIYSNIKILHIDLKIYGDKLIKTLGVIHHIKLHTKYIPYVLGNII